jgi:hypothetical protein
VQILELARNAQRLFERQEPRQKRRLLNFVLSNCTWEDGEVVATFPNHLAPTCAHRDPSKLPPPRRRRQGPCRSAEDDARPLPWRRGEVRRPRQRAHGRRRHRNLLCRHARNRQSGLGGALHVRAAGPRSAEGEDPGEAAAQVAPGAGSGSVAARASPERRCGVRNAICRRRRGVIAGRWAFARWERNRAIAAEVRG